MKVSILIGILSLLVFISGCATSGSGQSAGHYGSHTYEQKDCKASYNETITRRSGGNQYVSKVAAGYIVYSVASNGSTAEKIGAVIAMPLIEGVFRRITNASEKLFGPQTEVHSTERFDCYDRRR